MTNSSGSRNGGPRPAHPLAERKNPTSGRPNISPLSPIPLIVLAGKTGSGKSSFIKLLGGKDSRGQEPISDGGIDSCTRKPTTYTAEINNRTVLLLDTPGFDDSSVDNLTVLNDIASCLYTFALRPHEVSTQGVIFLHDISEIRFGGSQKKTLELLKSICGERSMKNVIIGTTMWNSGGSKQFQDQVVRESEFLDRHWRGIYKTVRVPDESHEVALGMVNDLLVLSPTTLLVQEEMSVPPHTCENTTVGKIAIPEGKREAALLRKELEEEQAKTRENLQRQEENYREQQERDRALFSMERAKLEEKARKSKEKFEKWKREEEEHQTQRLVQMAAEHQKAMQDAESRLVEREDKRHEEARREKEEMNRKYENMVKRMEKREADLNEQMKRREINLQEQMEAERKEYKERMGKIEEEMESLSEKLSSALEEMAKSTWQRFKEWLGFGSGKMGGQRGDRRGRGGGGSGGSS